MNRSLQKTAFLLAMVLSVFGMNANPVDMRTAREVAVKFMNANTRTPLRGTDDLQLVTTYNISRGDAAFYVFNTPNGFVIVSADDCATPILGYSNEGQFDVDNVPIQLQGILQGFVEQIQYGMENHLEADEQTARQWRLVTTMGRLKENRDGNVVEPLITTTWSQGCYYNAMCPEDVDGPCGRVLTGCTATAMAQILHYWGYPEHGIGTHSYAPPGYPEQSVDFGSMTYDWDHMPNILNNSSISEQIDAVATLMWHCGVSVNMHYGPDASMASLHPETLIDHFSYSNEMDEESTSNYSEAVWKAKLKSSLDLHRPLQYSGYTVVGMHAFVCDGYDNNDMFHFNWGWNGVNDGYYTISAMIGNLPFNTALFNIHPQGETTNYTINISVNNIEGGIVSGGGTFAHGDNVTLTAIANDGYCFHHWEENGGIASTDPNYSFPANFNRNLTAVFTDPVTISTSALEGGTVSDSGIYCYYEECEVIATPDEGYDFLYWTENDEIVSIEANYSFIVSGERHLTAHFMEGGIIDFADANTKAVCLSQWDDNGDGELSLAEAFRVTSIGQAFRSNTDITSFDELQYFPNLTTIDDNAFNGCSNLTSLVFPEGITSIGSSAFYGCSGLTSLTFPDFLTTIGNSAFKNCSGLISLNLPNTLTTIGDSVFYGCSGMASLTFPDSLTTIGNSAFYGCSGLTGCLSLPNTLTTIGDYAFYHCSGFSGGLSIPNSVTIIGDYAFCGCSGFTGNLTISNNINSIGYCTFYGCQGFTGNLIIPNSVTVIGDYAFFGCSGFTGSLTIPNSITSIGGFAFCNCSGFTGNLTIPGSVWSIGNSAFCYCSGFTGNLTISDSVRSIGDSAFYFCSGFEGNLTIGNFVTSIGNRAFYHCHGFAGNLTIPESVRSIGEMAFANCTGFTGSLTIPNSVGTIGEFAFSGCSGLNGNLTIMNSVYSIGSYAFSGISGLKSIIVLRLQPATAASNSFEHDIPLYVPCESFEAYRSATGWNAFSNIIGMCSPGTVSVAADPVEGGIVSGAGTYEGGTFCIVIATSNEGYCFANWTENGRVVSSDSTYSFVVTGESSMAAHFVPVGNIVFADANVKALCVENWDTNGDGELSYHEAAMVTSIGNVFTGNVEIISFEELQYFIGVSMIDNHAFNNCYNLTSVTIPSSVTRIGNYAFYRCSGLTGSLEIPYLVTIIGNYAFQNCSGFTGSLTIGNSVTAIGEAAFNNCNGFTGDLTIGNSVITIGNYAFYNCNGFTGDLTIGNSVITIGNYAFYNCNGFTGDLTMGNSVTSIGNYAFYGCNGFAGNLTIGSSVATIGDYAFLYCSNFTSVKVLPETPPTAGNAFYSDLYGILVHVPCGSLAAYQEAEGWSNFTNYQEDCLQTQIVNLSQGTNWVSFYVNTDLDALRTALEPIGGSPADPIVIQANGVQTLYNGARWRGALSALDLAQMYKITVPVGCEIELEGVPLNPAELQITIKSGANWMGFPFQQSMTVTEAFAGLPPVNGDVVRTKNGGQATYTNQWRGALNELVPGVGYIYNSAATENRTFTFPTSAK